jgi:hypothetical protein
MSISGISGSNSNQYQLSPVNLLQQELQQLGQALQSGNLSTAQSDFATLQAAFSQPAATTGSSSSTTASSTTSATSTSSSAAQAFTQLASDLKSGSLSAAQKDYSTIQQDLHNNLAFSHFHHGHHMDGGSGSTSGLSSLLQDLNQLGTSLTSNNLTSAQQAYATLEQQLQQSALGGGTLSSSQTSALLVQPLVSLEV